MNRITYEGHIVGKTISKVFLENYMDEMCIVFSDGSYIVFDVDSGYHGDCPTISVVDGELSNRQLLDFEILSREDYDRMEKDKQDLRRSKQHLQQLELYKKLKEQFEGKQ